MPALAGCESLSQLLRRESLPLNTRCGERGLCDGCMVELVKGRLVNTTTGSMVKANGTVVAARGCEHRLAEGHDECEVRIPARSLLAHEPQVVTSFRLNVARAHDPLWRQVNVRRIAPAPGVATAEALATEVSRLIGAEDRVEIQAGALRQLGEAGASDEWIVTVTRVIARWFVVEVAAAPARSILPIGVAIDIGTTTVAVILIDMRDGSVIGQAAGFNRQMHLGDDVLTRINLCSTDKSMVGQLGKAIVHDTIRPLLREAMKNVSGTVDEPQSIDSLASLAPMDQSFTPHPRLTTVVLNGNTTMLHLAAGVDPTPMGFAPFQPVFTGHQVTTAQQLELVTPLGDDPTVHLLPSAAAYIGADLTAGVLASGLLYDDGPSVLLDVGTNGEIIFKHGDRLLGCATAAGPAFEGAKLASGIRAGRGAIETIRLDRDPFAVHVDVIGNTKPIGVCGSAYIDLLAEARRIELISPTGRFQADTIGPTAQAYLIKETMHGLSLCLAKGQGARDIVVSEPDIASLMQAKAAIAAGILTLLKRAGVTPARVKRLYLAGGFGMHINVANAIAIGLLPDFAAGQVQVVGNTSLAGAYLSLLDQGALGAIEVVARRIEPVELNLDPGFEACYIDQLSLP